MSTTASRDLLLPQPPPGMGRGALLALLVHAGLIAALAFSVNWRTSNPEGVEAELWAAVPTIAAAPAAPAPEPTPPTPRVAPPPPAAQAIPTVDAEIALEKARAEKEKAKQERAERERAERQREEREQLEREKAERDKAAREKAALDKAAKERDREREKREAERLAELREKNLQRALGLAGATGAANATGNATQTAGPSASYAGRIKARIKPNIVFSDSIDGNPLATVEVRAAADGTITGRRLVRSSGVPAWDEAVLRAIDKTEVLPRDTDGRVPRSFEIDFRPRE